MQEPFLKMYTLGERGDAQTNLFSKHEERTRVRHVMVAEGAVDRRLVDESVSALSG